MTDCKPYVLGVIGGMGPKASSFFVERLYSKIIGKCDHEHPDIVALTMSSFTDRSKMLLEGRGDILISRLQIYIDYLLGFAVSEIIIPCFTMHAIIRSSGCPIEEKVVMLDDIMMTMLNKERSKTLLLCTLGSYASNLFITKKNKEFMLYPDDEDKEAIHQIIYRIKMQGVQVDMYDRLRLLMEKYRVDSMAFGCTEFHMLNYFKDKLSEWRVIDPLEEICNLFSQADLSNFHTKNMTIRNSLCPIF